MPDYQKLYHMLFNKITDVVDELQYIQQQAEQEYLDADDTPIELVPLEEDEGNNNPQKD